MSTDEPAAAKSDANELDSLRAENARLQQEVDTMSADTRHRGLGWLRSTAVVVLMTLGFVLVPTSVVAVWTHNQLMNTNRYAALVTPLADNPAVQSAVADDISTKLFEQVDVQQLLVQYLPPKLDFAAPTIASQIESQVNGLILKALQTPEFRSIWVQANTDAHKALVTFLNGNTASNVSIQGDSLVIDLGPYISTIKQNLVARGLSFASQIPDVNPSVTVPVANISALQRARTFMHVFNVLAYLLPLLMILCFGLAIWLSRNRRRTVIWTGVLIAVGAVTIGLGIAVLRTAYLGAATSSAFPHDAASSVYDTMIRFIRSSNRLVLAAGILIALAAAITGPYPWAVKLRGTFGGAIESGGRRSGFDSGPVGAWVARHARVLRIVVVLVGALVLVLWSYPTANVLLWLALAVLVLLGVIQFLVATAHGPDQAETPAPEPVDTKTG